MAKQKPTATAIAQSVEIAEGHKPARQNRATSNKALTRSVVQSSASKIALSNRVLEVWATLLAQTPEGPLKWQEYIRVTELLAKYAGLLEDQGKTSTVNQVIFDLRSSSEQELLQHLERLRQSASLSQPSPEEGGGLEEGTPEGTP